MARRPTAPAPRPAPTEIEIKLALLAREHRTARAALARLPMLAGRAGHTERLRSIYWDTPARELAAAQVALRLRSASGDTGPAWVQTLKTANRAGALVSRRGEWNHPTPRKALDPGGLPPEVWSAVDPDGTLFPRLVPSFSTDFRRTTWLLQAPQGARVELALDLGHVHCASGRVRLCELELESVEGPPEAVGTLARELAESVAVWPTRLSKAARAARLLEGRSIEPVCSAPPELEPGMPFGAAAQRVLSEAFWQFADNLLQLRDSDEPELAHQARIGWRRLRVAQRLFGLRTPVADVPDPAPLRPLLAALGHLRDVEVALLEVLPGVAADWLAAHARRRTAWRKGEQILKAERERARRRVLAAMGQPACGACMVALALWIDDLGAHGAGTEGRDREQRSDKAIDRDWAGRKLRRLDRRLETAVREAASEEQWHRARLLAKRLRYAAESLASLAPRRKTLAQRKRALDIQRRVGAGRDAAQAAELLARLGAPALLIPGIASTPHAESPQRPRR